MKLFLSLSASSSLFLVYIYTFHILIYTLSSISIYILYYFPLSSYTFNFITLISIYSSPFSSQSMLSFYQYIAYFAVYIGFVGDYPIHRYHFCYNCVFSYW